MRTTLTELANCPEILYPLCLNIPPSLDSPVSADVRGEGGVVSSHDVGGDIAGEEIEDGDDVDYNYLADQQPEEEKEEFRNDRAVKIPRKLSYIIKH